MNLSNLKNRGLLRQAGFSLAAFLALHLLFALLSGKGFRQINFYNSYSRQCAAWLQGRLDLGQDYPWLELAVFEGKYYVSFPPFPSYVLLPFAAIWGEDTPDLFVALLTASLGLVYGVRIAAHLGKEGKTCAFLPLFLYCGTAVWQVTVDGWVWFIAQNMALTLTLMSFFYALTGKRGRSLFLLCCAIGCRPFQLVYLPLVLCLLWQNTPGETPAARLRSLLFGKFWVWLPAAALAGSYLALNYARFGNVLEFGHNYLPEFTGSVHGQFSLAYVPRNFLRLFRFVSRDLGEPVFPMHDGVNIFLAFPILVWYIWRLARTAASRGKSAVKPQLFLLLLTALHLFFLLLHKTMGGFHYGNRYVIDLLPAFFLGFCLLPEETGPAAWKRADALLAALLFCVGLACSFTGVLGMYRMWAA